jgi:hypothetical protein
MLTISWCKGISVSKCTRTTLVSKILWLRARTSICHTFTADFWKQQIDFYHLLKSFSSLISQTRNLSCWNFFKIWTCTMNLNGLAYQVGLYHFAPVDDWGCRPHFRIDGSFGFPLTAYLSPIQIEKRIVRNFTQESSARSWPTIRR